MLSDIQPAGPHVPASARGIGVYENDAQASETRDGHRFWIASLADPSTGATDLPGRSPTSPTTHP